ncbi:MAG: hypothetical protein ACI4XN_03470 [Candidatus Kurthia intestinigallinarum]
MTEKKPITKEMIQQEILRLGQLLNNPSVTEEQYLKEKEKLNQMLAAFQKQA